MNRPARKKWTYCGNFKVKNPGVRRRREYDHFICSKNLKGKVEDVINYRTSKHDSDHCIRYARICLSGMGLNLKKKFASATSALRMKSVPMEVGDALINRFAPLRALIDREEDDFNDLGEQHNVIEIWEEAKKLIHGIAVNTKLDKVKTNPWITEETMALIENELKFKRKQRNRSILQNLSKKI